MKFVSRKLIFLIIVIAIINKSISLSSENINKQNKNYKDSVKIIKKCPGFYENIAKQDDIEVSNYVFFIFIISYFYTNYL